MPSSKSRSRRGDHGRRAPSRLRTWIDRTRATQAVLPIGVGLGFFVLASLIVVKGGEPFGYRLGQTVSGKQIVARVPVPDPEKLRSLQEVEERSTANYYVLNEALLKGVQAALTNLLEKARANETLDALTGEFEKQNRTWALDEEAFRALRDLSTEKEAVRFSRLMEGMMDAAKAEPLVRQLTLEDRSVSSSAQYTVLRAEKPEAVSNDRLKYVSNGEHVEDVATSAVKDFPRQLRKALAAKWREALQPDPENRVFVPIYEFDKQATDEAIEAARSQVSWQRAAKAAGTPICEPGIIRERELEALRIEHRVYLDALGQWPAYWNPSLQRTLGLSGIVLFVTVGMSAYVWWFGSGFVLEPRPLFGFVGVSLVMLLMARLGALAGWSQELAVVPVVMTGAILTIAFGQRLAFGASSGMAVLVTAGVGGDFGLFLVLMSSMGVAVFTLREIRTRSKVLDVGGLTALGAFFASACVNLLPGQTVQYSGQAALTAAASALAAGFIIFGILPVIERMFDVTTALTLLEWGSIHQPLLRRLSEEAPGTYSHSQRLADMAEAAAEAAGADGLLTRTGAYYHDVGKLVKPTYFVENYEMRADHHSKLQPTMSMLIISGHVRDGLELARQYGVPRTVRGFIAEHHGTTLVEYFYHEASARQAAEGNRGPSESEFRYPGPKPQSKEAAILMLSDGVEGAVRSLSDPTAGRIESTVHHIAMNRLMDGQLDECHMTLKDLRGVEDSLTRSLIAIYHKRIAYPKDKGEDVGGEGAKASKAESAG